MIRMGGNKIMRITRSVVAIGAVIVMMALAAVIIPTDARAQSSTTGAIAGVVKDGSGAILPGVTVVAESPALIEKSRTVVTDDHGQYKIIDLRPGVYTVTFSSAGFATIKREGLELNTGVTLPIDAEMKVGSVAQSVTVTSATPVVDVENSSPENVLTNTELTTVPQAGGIQGLNELTLAGTLTATSEPDVGGNKGEQISSIMIHDSRTNDDDELMDGMSWSSGQSTGGEGQRSYVINKVSVQEITISTGPGSPEAGHLGANLNIVPREGGDQFHGAVNFTGATTAWQSKNLNAALLARGLVSGQNIKHIYDFGAGIGGPILHGKLWFWSGFGDWASLEFAPGNYFNATQNTLFYTPDLKRPAYTNTWNYAYDIRLTWQASPKNKFSAYQGFEDFCLCFQSVDTGNISPEAANNNLNRASFLTQGAWTREQTNKLLFRAGITSALAPGRVNAYSPGVTPSDVPIVEQSTGYGYHAFLGLSSLAYGHPVYDELNGIATVSYISGSHALKAGYVWQWNNQNYKENLNTLPGVGPVSYVLNQPTGAPAPVPVSLTEYATPLIFTARSWVEALYAEDQWTIRRLTLNLGVRYDWERGNAPAQTAQSYFTPLISLPAKSNIPAWNDIEPRVGAAYDLFGNGKTAIKGAIGRYPVGDYTTTAIANTPANAIVTSATRNWTMSAAEIAASGGNYVPNCNLLNVAANGDCGALSNNGFGTVATNTTYDPKVLHGWDVRPYNWQMDVQLQQQIIPGMGVTVGYFRTWYENLTVTENTDVPSSGYGTYCITGPTDSRVSALTGKQVCGFHDVDPAYYGKVQNLVTHASNFGGQSEVFNGVDISVNARYGHGGIFNGGVSLGRTVDDDCAIAQNYPNVTATMTNIRGTTVMSTTTTPTQFCHIMAPWGVGSQVKAAGSYPLPWWGIVTSLTYQNLPGYAFNTSYVATNAQIAKSLGRNISACGTMNPCNTTVTLGDALYAPYSQSESRLNQLDLRFAKVFKVKERLQIKGNFDIYNIANANTIVSENTTYSATNTYLRPNSILGPRMFKLGTNITF
jgi:Carboxypeptidase regulatory-like domain